MKMTKEEARSAIKQYLPTYLQSLGIDTSKPFHCLNPDHEDSNPSMRYTSRKGKDFCHCFACNATYDTFDVVMKQTGLTDFKEAFDYCCNLMDIQVEGKGKPKKISFKSYEQEKEEKRSEMNEEAKRIKPYIDKCSKDIEKTDYLVKRGISYDTQKRFGVGYDEAGHKLVIPTSYCSYVTRSTNPNVGKEYRYYKSSFVSLFADRSAINGCSEPIFIVEGEIDALSIYEAGGTAIGLGSTNNYGRLLRYLEANPPLKPVILLLDNDNSGRECTNKLINGDSRVKGLEEMGIEYTRGNPYWIGKDPNEALMKDREWFMVEIQRMKDRAEELHDMNEKRKLIEYMQPQINYETASER